VTNAASGKVIADEASTNMLFMTRQIIFVRLNRRVSNKRRNPLFFSKNLACIRAKNAVTIV